MTKVKKTPQIIRVAVIGNGRWGKNIIKTLETIPSCALTHVATREYEALLSYDDIDAVVVATPPSTHASIALPFIKKGFPVFIEKPLAGSLADAKKIARAAAKSNALIFVGHIHLYNPAYLAAKELSKKAGRLRLLIGEGASNGPFRSDYSAMWDWAPHDISMMLDLSKEFPQSVQAWGSRLTRPRSGLHDIAQIKLEFPSGLIGIVTSSKLSPEKRRKLTISGTKNAMIYDDTVSAKVTLFENAGPTIAGKTVKENQPVISNPEYENVSPLTRELEAFIEMARTGKKPRTGIESGLAVVSILEAAEKSIAASGKRISIKR